MKPQPIRHPLRRPVAPLALVLVASSLLSACAPLVVGGAMLGGSMLVTDRRTSGTQVDDQTIELKAMNRVRDAIGDRGHVSVTSYNRAVLITGEVPADADKATVEQAVQRVQNIRSIVNELGVMGSTSLTSRSNDALLSSKVKASFIDAKDLSANTIKVVTERGVVYLMGRLTDREAERAIEVARGVGGVTKVVRLFETITEAELADMAPKAPAK
jgi:osmotically-inducible protein OsmY